MPFKFNVINGSPSFVDNEYEIVDKDLLAQFVGEMLLGHHHHILRIIRSLSTTFPVQKNDSIDQIIAKIRSTSASKRDGWLFQMISWIVLAKSKSAVPFFSNYPHFAPAQHGIDGLAITLNSDDTIENIIITEDKCTANPRNKIVTQVFPEFKEFEKGAKDNALVGIISSLIGGLNAGEILEKVQNDIFENKFRLYRIGITRNADHNPLEGRISLFLNYDKSVEGDSSVRRSASSIHIEDMRVWMNDFANKVITYLESKKS
ncbi:hypothetical protein HNP37_001862 [Flavobacterium nitrogenifigens]|uniref:Anti-bacteriophage protein A/HamA C-terminal domain-containing protein n=2 Tax=Flavobacterium TaxID=237 RepID=A0A7W7IWD8_9FLAO|nr:MULTISPECIES: hypothetical protein [Flavobacterium]MBB4801801.1 hypothetical protein [Flavobacterium nitrogenifigens]MBB6386759.1 hypothetical protein [Flavobacterium notoginsengisoli]WDF58102.1 hypothetical protein PQ462_15400 [Flavobacterium sp. KACC 22758]